MATSLAAAAAATTHTATEQLQEEGWAAHETTKGMEKKWRDGEREGKKLNAAKLHNYMATEAPECLLPQPELWCGGTPPHTCGAREP